MDQRARRRPPQSGDPRVHGGPGEAQWIAAAKYQPWEKDFTVVQWDQRGAGRTFGRNGPQTPDVNLERITRDGIEVAEYLCRTLEKKKIMVQRRPELFAAYVGTGQVASWKASVQTQFDVLLAKARGDWAWRVHARAGSNVAEESSREHAGLTRRVREGFRDTGPR